MRQTYYTLLPLLATPSLLAAQQIHGQVLGAGQPLADAVVALWGAHSELARTTTATSGEFAFRTPSSDTVYTIAVRAVGYHPLWIPLASVDTARIVLTLTPFVLALPELAAETEARRCPIPDEPSARQLWEAVVSRYSVPSPTRGMAVRVRQWTATVGSDEVGSFNETQLNAALQGTNGLLRSAAARSIDSLGYARRLTAPFDLLLNTAAGNDLYFQWWYPSLDTWDFEQWLAPPFSRRHSLARILLTTGAIDLVFCPRDKGQPGLAGVMHLGPDTTLESVTWTIRTAKPSEQPGGRIDFGRLPGSPAPLQPVRSVYWRLVGGSKDRYLQRVTIFSELVIGATDSIPRLAWTE